jgi:hypothetical protein
MNIAPLALTVLYKAEPGQMCRLFGGLYAESKIPLLIEEKSGQKKTKETKSLTHETRQ